jgi:hypothetical protein
MSHQNDGCNPAMGFIVLIVAVIYFGYQSYSLKLKTDDDQKKISTFLKDSAASKEKISSLEQKVSECNEHKYSLFNSGYRTWRVNAVTGDSCIALTTNFDWKSADTKRQSCICEDLFQEGNTPSEYLRKSNCGW